MTDSHDSGVTDALYELFASATHDASAAMCRMAEMKLSISSGGSLSVGSIINASGTIIWHHDGWLSPAALNRDVRAALARR